MKIKISEATPNQINHLVAVCEGISLNEGNTLKNECDVYSPSTDWEQGGPIIEREQITLEPVSHDEHGDGWLATRIEGPAVCMEFGPTILIAAMRCFVASKLGDEVDVPNELV